MEDFLKIVKSDITPAYKKANLTLIVNRRGLGTNGNDVTFTGPVAKYAEFDGPSPLVKALGQHGLAKLVAKIGPMAAVFETIVRTRVSELSF